MTRLKTVVLPDPFGPIRPVIVPCLDGERAVVDGDDAAEPLVRAFDLEQRAHDAATSFGCARRGGVCRDAQPPASGRASDGRIPARQQQHHDEEHGRVADEVELARAEPVREVLLRRDEDEGAEHRPPDRPSPAEVDHQHHPDRDQRVDRELRVDEREVVGPDAAGHRDEPGRERERRPASRSSSARRGRARGPRRRGSRRARARACSRARTSSTSIDSASTPSIA